MKKTKMATLLCSCGNDTYDNIEEMNDSASELTSETSGEETTLTASDYIVDSNSDNVNNAIPSELDV